MRGSAALQRLVGLWGGCLSLLLSPGLKADELTQVGTWPGYHRGVPREILVRGSLLYCVVQSGLAIYDLSDANQPVRAGEWVAPRGIDPWRVAVDGSRATVLDSAGNLFALDVSDPSSPRAVGSIRRSLQTLNLDLRDSLAVLIAIAPSAPYRVEIWDLFTESTPRLRGAQDLTFGTLSAGFVGSNTVAVLSTDGLTTYRMTAGEDMTLLGRMDGTFGGQTRLRTRGTRALVTPGPLKVFDFSDPAAPEILKHSTFDRNFITSEWDGQMVRAVIDSNLESYRLEGSVWIRTQFPVASNLANPNLLAADGNRVVVGSPAPGLQILSSARPPSLVPGSKMTNFGFVSRTKLKDRVAYLADGTGVQILHLTNLANPRPVRRLTLSHPLSTGTDLDLRGDRLVFTENRSGVAPSMYDVSTPAAPSRLSTWFNGSLALSSVPRKVRFARERDVLVLGISGTVRYLLSETPNHWRLSAIQDAISPGTSAICGASPFPAFQDVVTLADGNRIFMSDPFLTVIGGKQFRLPDNAQGMALAGNYTYVACGAAGLIILEGSRLDFLKLSETATTAPATAVAVELPYAFVGTSDGGVEVFDVLDPTQPTRVAAIVTPGGVSDIEVSGSTVLVSKGDFGLSVLEFHPSRPPQQIHLSPLYDRPTNSLPFAITAVSSSGLPVHLKVLAGPAEVDGSLCRPTGRVGRVLVRAESPGDEATAPAAVEGLFSFTRPLTNAFQNWIYSNYPQIRPDERALANDPDQDGVPNETEHYFGTDPSVPDDPARLPLPRVDQVEGSRFLVIEFPVQREPWAPLKWSQRIQILTDLPSARWFTVPEEWVSEIDNRVRVRVPLPSGPDAEAPDARFVRVGPRTP